MYTFFPVRSNVFMKFSQKLLCKSTSVNITINDTYIALLPHEIHSNVVLILDLLRHALCSGTEARSNWLINPHHVRQIHVRIWVRVGSICSRLPKKWTVLLEQTKQRATSWPSIQPDRDLVLRRWIVAREEPEEHLVLILGVTID